MIRISVRSRVESPEKEIRTNLVSAERTEAALLYRFRLVPTEASLGTQSVMCKIDYKLPTRSYLVRGSRHPTRDPHSATQLREEEE